MGIRWFLSQDCAGRASHLAKRPPGCGSSALDEGTGSNGRFAGRSSQLVVAHTIEPCSEIRLTGDCRGWGYCLCTWEKDIGHLIARSITNPDLNPQKRDAGVLLAARPGIPKTWDTTHRFHTTTCQGHQARETWP